MFSNGRGRDPVARGRHGGKGASLISNTSYKGKRGKPAGKDAKAKGGKGKGGKGGAAGGLDRWG